MKRQPRDLDEVLKRSFGCDTLVARAQIETAWERIVNGAAGAPVRSMTIESRQRPIKNWQRLAIATVAILLAVLGSITVTNRSKAAGTFEMAGGTRGAKFDEILRSTDSAGAMLVLDDGSRVEMRSGAALSLERVADGVRIQLNEGSILVSAANQVNGHLYVQTQDVTVSVVGTVFLVSRETAGSRVAVIQGEVHVEQRAMETRLRPGQQIATTPSLPTLPIVDEIAWSRGASEHLELLRQSTARVTAGAVDTTRFEVSSIRPETGGGGVRGAPVRCNAADGVFPLGRGGGSAGLVDGTNVPRGHCGGRYVTASRLIAAAYAVAERNVLGGPDWVRSDSQTFQLDAKADDAATATKDQLRVMLQNLLADRFQLRLRHETKEASGFALAIGRNGPKLPTASGEPELYLEQDGRRSQVNLLRGGMVSIKGRATLQAFADYLATAPFVALNHVVDRTNLTGMYEFSLALNMVPLDLSARGGTRGAAPETSSPRIEWDPSIAKALEAQLGLSLLSEKVLEDVYVIEKLETPSEN